jgi:hypothetical protein
LTDEWPSEPEAQAKIPLRSRFRLGRALDILQSGRRNAQLIIHAFAVAAVAEDEMAA